MNASISYSFKPLCSALTLCNKPFYNPCLKDFRHHSKAAGNVGSEDATHDSIHYPYLKSFGHHSKAAGNVDFEDAILDGLHVTSDVRLKVKGSIILT